MPLKRMCRKGNSLSSPQSYWLWIGLDWIEFGADGLDWIWRQWDNGLDCVGFG
jgi:hypothetical protein